MSGPLPLHAEDGTLRILLIDNFDSYSYNLYHGLAKAGCEVLVVKNNACTTWAEVCSSLPPFAAVVVSPGPGSPATPSDFGLCSHAYSAGLPVLGVCLGHQGLALAFGGKIKLANEPIHGRLSAVTHSGGVLFTGVPSPFLAVRYHSLIVERETLPSVLRIEAMSETGEIMALRHGTLPLHGVQFHPESICTESGERVLANFVSLARESLSSAGAIPVGGTAPVGESIVAWESTERICTEAGERLLAHSVRLAPESIQAGGPISVGVSRSAMPGIPVGDERLLATSVQISPGEAHDREAMRVEGEIPMGRSIPVGDGGPSSESILLGGGTPVEWLASPPPSALPHPTLRATLPSPPSARSRPPAGDSPPPFLSHPTPRTPLLFISPAPRATPVPPRDMAAPTPPPSTLPQPTDSASLPPSTMPLPPSHATSAPRNPVLSPSAYRPQSLASASLRFSAQPHPIYSAARTPEAASPPSATPPPAHAAARSPLLLVSRPIGDRYIRSELAFRRLFGHSPVSFWLDSSCCQDSDSLGGSAREREEGRWQGAGEGVSTSTQGSGVQNTGAAPGRRGWHSCQDGDALGGSERGRPMAAEGPRAHNCRVGTSFEGTSTEGQAAAGHEGHSATEPPRARYSYMGCVGGPHSCILVCGSGGRLWRVGSDGRRGEIPEGGSDGIQEGGSGGMHEGGRDGRRREIPGGGSDARRGEIPEGGLLANMRRMLRPWANARLQVWPALTPASSPAASDTPPPPDAPPYHGGLDQRPAASSPPPEIASSPEEFASKISPPEIALPELPPFCGGLVGFFGYESWRRIGPEAAGAVNVGECGCESGTPEALFMFADRWLVFDHQDRRLLAMCLCEAPGGVNGGGDGVNGGGGVSRGGGGVNSDGGSNSVNGRANVGTGRAESGHVEHGGGRMRSEHSPLRRDRRSRSCRKDCEDGNRAHSSDCKGSRCGCGSDGCGANGRPCVCPKGGPCAPGFALDSGGEDGFASEHDGPCAPGRADDDRYSGYADGRRDNCSHSGRSTGGCWEGGSDGFRVGCSGVCRESSTGECREGCSDGCRDDHCTRSGRCSCGEGARGGTGSFASATEWMRQTSLALQSLVAAAERGHDIDEGVTRGGHAAAQIEIRQDSDWEVPAAGRDVANMAACADGDTMSISGRAKAESDAVVKPPSRFVGDRKRGWENCLLDLTPNAHGPNSASPTPPSLPSSPSANFVSNRGREDYSSALTPESPPPDTPPADAPPPTFESSKSCATSLPSSLSASFVSDRGREVYLSDNTPNAFPPAAPSPVAPFPMAALPYIASPSPAAMFVSDRGREENLSDTTPNAFPRAAPSPTSSPPSASTSLSPAAASRPGAPSGCFISDRGREDYLSDISRVFDLLRRGETYEVCLTTQFRARNREQLRVRNREQVRATNREQVTAFNGERVRAPNGDANGLRQGAQQPAQLGSAHESKEAPVMGAGRQEAGERQHTPTITAAPAAAIEALDLYLSLRRVNPAPYAAYLHVDTAALRRAAILRGQGAKAQSGLAHSGGRAISGAEEASGRPAISGSPTICGARAIYGAEVIPNAEAEALSPPPHLSFSVCCSSPERFLRVCQNGTVESKPIKGTASRGKTKLEDAAIALALRSSGKDRAENLMITDLVRNDLGRVCRVGSIIVPSLMEIETYTSVHQMVTTVRGRLLPNMDAIDAAAAAFPPGSMTGAPKTRTLRIIHSLEREVPRGVYSGTLGFFGVNGASDLNVVIRTAVISEEGVSLGAGGAIVIQSKPEEEWEEVLLKARPVMRAVERWLGGEPGPGGSSRHKLG